MEEVKKADDPYSNNIPEWRLPACPHCGTKLNFSVKAQEWVHPVVGPSCPHQGAGIRSRADALDWSKRVCMADAHALLRYIHAFDSDPVVRKRVEEYLRGQTNITESA